MAAHFLIRKKLFNSKCTQLHVTKDFAVAEKKLHLAISGRKYDPGKKTSKRKCTSDEKTSDPKPSTSQDKSTPEQQPQDEPVSEQQPQDEPVSEQQMSLSLSSNKTCLQLNNNNTLLIHLHLNPAMIVHFQIMAQLSKFLQQKIPVPYQRNQDTVDVRKLNNLINFVLFLFTDQKETRATF